MCSSRPSSPKELRSNQDESHLSRLANVVSGEGDTGVEARGYGTSRTEQTEHRGRGHETARRYPLFEAMGRAAERSSDRSQP